MAKLIAEFLLAVLLAAVGVVVYFMNRDLEYSKSFLEKKAAAAPAPAPPKAETASREPEKVTPDAEETLPHDGQTRRYLVHVPKGFDRGRKWPVVLAFHSTLGRAEGLRTQSRLNEAADRHGFLVVYPDGSGVSRLLTYNAGSCCGYAARERVDDVGFVRTLLDELARKYAVNERRVYATGIGNGAMLCYRLAAELPDRIAAIAPVAGSLTLEDVKPPRPVPVLHFHGVRDDNVPFYGGSGRTAYQPTPHNSVKDTIAWWVEANRRDPKPVETKGKDFVRKEYTPRPGEHGAPVVLYELPEGGHTWPGGLDTTAHLGTGRLVKSVDASELMWEFFARQALE